MASRGGSARRIPENEAAITYVQCDGLAVMKILKHCHEESCSNMEVAQGALLGLVVENRLEITNCFPFPKHDDTMDEEEYQLAMMRRLRRVNVDHFHVGWYQSADVGNFLSLSLLESQYHYQTSIEESVVVIYDTKKSARGFLTLKAYRLTPQAIQMYKEQDYTPEALRNLKIGYESLFIEVPIVIRNSPLTNIMMSELSEMIPEEEGSKFLDLGTASVLEGQLRSLMERVDELNQEAIKFNRYQQLVVRQQQDKHRWLLKRAQENAARAAKAIQMYKEQDYTPEALRNLKIGYESLFIEVPIVIRNSPLTNIMMSELSEMIPEEEGSKFLDLGTASVLEGQLRSLMERVDELNQEAIKFNRYQQLVVRQQQDKHRWLLKRAQENAARAAKDEPALPEEDVNKLFKPHPVPLRLNPMIVGGQINTYSQHISQFCSQSLAKLYVTQALQNAKETKEKN